MNGQFIRRIKQLENEVLGLKTAADFSAVSPASFQVFESVSVGKHTITYGDGDTPIFSSVGTFASLVGYGFVYAETPNGNTQAITVTSEDSSPVSVLVTSNREIVRID